MKKLIIIALIVSIITGFAVYKYATDLKNEYVIKTKPVVVAVKKIPKNTLIEPHIRQGDRVDIIATMINESVESKPVQSRMIAEYVEVLQVGVKSGSEEAYSSVTVSVHVNDLPRLNYALSEGKFRLVLRSIIDEKIANPAPYTP